MGGRGAGCAHTSKYSHPFLHTVRRGDPDKLRRSVLLAASRLRLSRNLPLGAYTKRAKGRGYRIPSLPGGTPTTYGRWTWTLARLVPASLLASTMQKSRPLPPLVVSSLSPSATLILSKPPPPLTTS